MPHDLNKPKYRLQTQAVLAGEIADPITGASTPSIVMSNSFVVSKPQGFSIESFDDERPYIYSRWDNPTVQVLERKLAALENAEDCACFGSGMAATAAVLHGFLSSGDHVVASDVHYAGASELIRSLKDSINVDSTRVDTSNLDMVENSIRPGATKLIWAETPSNPLLKITDLRGLSDLASRQGARLVVDSTVATPIATRPVELGVDLVVHSLSKYIGGHGDAIGGAVIGSRDLIEHLRTSERTHIGGILSPFNAWLIARGATTLPLRMLAHSNNAMQVAEFLEGHPRVTRVLYPGLPNHPGHSLAKQQMDCYSSLLSFCVHDGPELAHRLPTSLNVIHYAVSLGSYRSLIYWLPTDEMLRTAFLLTEELEHAYLSLAGEGIFRLAVGLEDPRDICEELDRVLSE
ncbi:MAG: aminotransferase class I/II-fold pyridoxal phosphate-dependent enzyme [Gammaproteobacteria bacterium]|nr:aminotransferase class I/II-fold pyridoxal phosphate-dependent enzyme [Gammaproteobacteria bacterium]